MPQLQFDNRFIRELPGDPIEQVSTRQVRKAIWSNVKATPVSAPKLLAWSSDMASELGLSPEEVQSPDFAEVFAGNQLWPGMQSYATRYGGHQFGNWAGQLGDGRALYLGEVLNQQGKRWELQLKGAGPTPYSRHADGRAVLRSSVREFLCSEAMYHLGVPTTRALSLILTGDQVMRDMFYDGHPAEEPGAIVCRVAPSFTRFGHFEILLANNEPELLKQLIDFTIKRDYPELTGEGEALRAAWFAQICERTAVMIAHWMRVGFVHGVMNTDNMSILGLTIDYGPYGWIDHFDPSWTPNTTDRQQRRYRFGNQAQIAYWNLAVLASALGEVFEEESSLEAGLERYLEVYTAKHQEFTAAKFGFAKHNQLAEQEETLVSRVYSLMQKSEVDMTIFFRRLAELSTSKPQLETLKEAFYTEAGFADFEDEWQTWLNDYVAALPTDQTELKQRREQMNAVNPIYVLRNYLAQEAIDLATEGDLSRIEALQRVLKNPYTEQPDAEHFAQKRPDWARVKAGCSMLSCSS